MARRRWLLVHVSTDVYCDSSGSYHFFARFTYRGRESVKVEYLPESGIADRGLPKYAIQALEDHIAFMARDKFTIYEMNREGNARRRDYRYHDPERFKYMLDRLYPLPF